jgi:hypothetical protein
MIVNDTVEQASFTIVTYDRKNIFIIQATDNIDVSRNGDFVLDIGTVEFI